MVAPSFPRQKITQQMVTKTTKPYLGVAYNAPQVRGLVNQLAADIENYYGPVPFILLGQQ